jgi:hypothetical protein
MNRFMGHLAGNGWSHFIFGPAFEKGFSHGLGPKQKFDSLQSGLSPLAKSYSAQRELLGVAGRRAPL